MGGHTKLGSILRRRARLRGEQIEHALRLQQRQHVPLGKILLHEGYINHRQLQEALAEQGDLPFVALASTLRDTGLLEKTQLSDYLEKGYLPLRREGSALLVAAIHPNEALRAYLPVLYQCPIRYVITSPLDIRLVLVEQFGQELTRIACDSVFQQHPEYSAKQLFSRRQTHLIWLLFAAVALAVLLLPGALPALCVAACLLYAVSILFKLVLLSVHQHYTPPDSRKDLPRLPDAELPHYTVLVPLYKESAMLPRLAEALRAIDYPHAKLDIKLVIEEDDLATLHKAREMRLEYRFDIVLVPYSLPRTKPKACNYALHFAQGDYVTIYDAEDRPHPLQLRKAAALFRQHPSLLCLQARLNYENREQNLLTGCFALEYAIWFDVLLPGLAALGMPIPLGGTSNHLPRRILQEHGSWDAYNVTEDADLGIRLAMMAPRRILPMRSLTLEIAPSRLPDWIKQRTRWIKGYMQTWVVHMRRPMQLWQRLGWKGFLGFQLFIGGPSLTFLLAPFLWLAAGLWLAGAFPPIAPQTASLLGWLSLFNIVSSLLVHLWLALEANAHHAWRGKPAMLAILAFPFYWLLHSIASFRAVWQLFTAPHYWDKTPHTPPT